MKVIEEDKVIILYRYDLAPWNKMVPISNLICCDFRLTTIDVDSANKIVFIDCNGNMKVLKDRDSHLKGGRAFFDMADLTILTGKPNK